MKKRAFFFSFPQVIKFIESIDFGNTVFLLIRHIHLGL